MKWMQEYNRIQFVDIDQTKEYNCIQFVDIDQTIKKFSINHIRPKIRRSKDLDMLAQNQNTENIQDRRCDSEVSHELFMRSLI